MTIIRTTATILALATAGFSASAQAETYRAEANDQQAANLFICDDNVTVTVRGDGDTDLDFRILNASGAEVFSDYQTSDVTSTTLTRYANSGCETFRLEVINLGGTWNEFVVTLEAATASYSTAIVPPPVAPVQPNAPTQSLDDQNREVTIRNNTGETLFYLYWTNSASSDWGVDQLGTYTITPGQHWAVTVEDSSRACNFNFKAVTDNGREYYQNNVDVCAVSFIDF